MAVNNTPLIRSSEAHCTLDAIIDAGFHENSDRGMQFRQWATSVLRDFAIRGYVLDKERLKSGAFVSEDYFNHLLAEIQEIRASERTFYQKLTDIYATSKNYNPNAEVTKAVFSAVQNKLHIAIHGPMAAELIGKYLDYAEDQAERKIPMTMEDWAKKLNAFLKFNKRDILDHPGKVTHDIAQAFAESEFEKYRIVQDRLYESDFDKMVKQVGKGKE